MARPYSTDLRDRAVARVQAGESVRAVAETLSNQPVERCEVVTAVPSDGQFCAWANGRSPAACSGWRAARLAPGEDRRVGLHLARSCSGARRTRPQGGLPDGVELHARRGAELQKKAFCPVSRIARMWRGAGRDGKSIRAESTLRASSSSMRHGPKSTWRRCEAGARGAAGSRRGCRTAIGRR